VTVFIYMSLGEGT